MVSIEDLDELLQEANIERQIDDAKLLEHLNDLIARLKPVDRNVLLLYLEGLKASILGGVGLFLGIAVVIHGQIIAGRWQEEIDSLQTLRNT